MRGVQSGGPLFLRKFDLRSVGDLKVQPHSEQPSSVTSLFTSVTFIFRTLSKTGVWKKGCPQSTLGTLMRTGGRLNSKKTTLSQVPAP